LDNPYLSNLVLRHKQWFNKDELEDYVRRPFQEGGLGFSEWFVSECPRIAWVGQEFNVRGQAKVIFKRDASENALVIGNNSNARYGMIAGIIASICANLEPNNTQFAIYNGSTEGAEWQNILPTIRESLITACGFVVDYVNESGVEGLIDKLCGELDRRNQLNDIEKNQSPSIFVVKTELERIRELRRSLDKFSSMVDTPLGEKLRRLYVDGSFVGIHLILSFSAVTSMQHIIDPKRGLINFRHRIALQMSEDDSHTLLQSRAASRLQQHGSEQIRALYVDTDGNKETIFKPYTHTIDKSNNKQPLIDDIATIGKQLARRVAQ
jgi:S-DNA-T family DNA segregation ATPase FtsK/SpoIIIE